jgi:hypothetical protein
MFTLDNKEYDETNISPKAKLALEEAMDRIKTLEAKVTALES